MFRTFLMVIDFFNKYLRLLNNEINIRNHVYCNLKKFNRNRFLENSSKGI